MAEGNIVVSEDPVSMVDAVDDGRTDTAGRINPGNTIQQFIRTCRHMGIAESSPICDICNLETRMQYGDCEVDYRENMDDSGMVSISVPVELAKNVEHYVDAMIALDYVKRNHADILLYAGEDMKN